MTALFHSAPSLREEQLPGGGHTSLILRKGQILRLTDIEGGANVSMMMLNPHEKSERPYAGLSGYPADSGVHFSRGD